MRVAQHEPESCPALDRHDDAAAEVQLCTNKFSIFEETLTHNGQGGPKLFIFVAPQVHVIDNQDAARSKCRHRPGQLQDLPTWCVREYQVELTETTNDLSPVTRLEANPWRPWSCAGRLLHLIVKFDGEDLDVITFTEPVNQPSESDADASADLKNPATFGNRPR